MGGRLGRWLSQTAHVHSTSRPTPPALLKAALRPGDVLLVEGNSRVSVAIKYLTQSTWSHAALYVGPQANQGESFGGDPDAACFVEADIMEGVRLVGFAEFDGLHTRICRPVGLGSADLERVIAYALARVGQQYDLKNVLDLARYLIPTPPVPVRWRRRLLAFGSGDPSRAICSTLVAQCFQSIRYPILPIVTEAPAATPECPECVQEIYRVRHHSLFVPRDFDVSPYFGVVKPTLEQGFDFRCLRWDHTFVGESTAAGTLSAGARASARLPM
jgi:hypothetical protein